MEVESDNKELKRRAFLLVALENKNVSQEQFDKEMPALEIAIKENLLKKLAECKENMDTEIVQIKKTVFSDGDLKRAVARTLIKFLEPSFANHEIRGIMRQGYKLMRIRE